jgi:hypothetical protein
VSVTGTFKKLLSVSVSTLTITPTIYKIIKRFGAAGFVIGPLAVISVRSEVKRDLVGITASLIAHL